MKPLNTILLLLILICYMPGASAESSWATQTLNSLTLDEKIGQLFMITALAGDENENKAIITQKPYRMDPTYIEQILTTYHPGGIIYLGNNDPELFVQLTKHYQEMSAIPLLIGMDFEWGLAMRIKNTIAFPRAMTLGAITDNSIIQSIAQEIGIQAQKIGVHLIFAPVIDVNTNSNNPVIGTRAFSDCPDTVAQKGIAFMRGLHAAGILSCAKHFPGHGDTSLDSHYALPCINHSKERLYSIEFFPFKELINAGVCAIMVGHIALPALNTDPLLPATLSRTLVTDVLRNSLGFNGLIITDALDMHGVTAHFGAESALLALQAGCDILICPPDIKSAHALIKQAILVGKLSEKELDMHVLKILRAKETIFYIAPQKPSYSLASLDTTHALALKQHAFDAAITVLGNTTIIPIACNATIGYVQIGKDELQENRCLCAIKNRHSLTARILTRDNPVVPTQPELNSSAVIVALYPSAGIDVQMIALTYLKALRENHITSIAIIYGSPYQAKPFIKVADTIIVAYEDTPEAHAAVGAILTGAQKAMGKLPIDVAE